MKYLGILAVLVSMLLLFGCTSQSPNQEQNASTNTNNGLTNNYTTTVEGNTTVTTNIDSSSTEWCVAGGFYDIAGTGTDTGTISGNIKGYVTYKGGQYCQIDSSINTGGYNIAYTYYISSDQKDMWVVMDVGGQTQEIHVNAETGEVLSS